VMAANDLDAIVALTNGPAWVTNSNPAEGDLDGNFDLFVGSSTASAVAGYGSITVPAGHIGPLPIGLSFIGGRWSEPQLIGLAYDFEQATHVRVPPQFLASVTLPAAAGQASAQAQTGHPGKHERQALSPGR